METSNGTLKDSTLVPIDFSENSMYALDCAEAIASALNDNNKITLLHIIENGNFPPVKEVGHITSDINGHDALAIEGALNRLHKIASEHNKGNIEYSFVVASGKAYKEIARIAEEIKADNIVMGTHGASGVQTFAGSNASKVIQLANCPVVVIKRKPTNFNGFKNIVLPLDLTQETRQKVNFAVKLAQHYDSTIHLLSMTDNDEFLATRLENNLNQVELYLTERGIKTTSTTLDASGGNFIKQTLVWTEAKGADLIIIMSQQDKELREYIFGAYAQQIVNKSNIPVMAVNPNPELEGIIDSTIGSGIYRH